jgi:hypothetical protein
MDLLQENMNTTLVEVNMLNLYDIRETFRKITHLFKHTWLYGPGDRLGASKSRTCAVCGRREIYYTSKFDGETSWIKG